MNYYSMELMTKYKLKDLQKEAEQNRLIALAQNGSEEHSSLLRWLSSRMWRKSSELSERQPAATLGAATLEC